MMVTSSKKKDNKGEMNIQNLGYLFATSFYFYFLLFYLSRSRLLAMFFAHFPKEDYLDYIAHCPFPQVLMSLIRAQYQYGAILVRVCKPARVRNVEH